MPLWRYRMSPVYSGRQGRMTCPYGHDDRSDNGHCLAEVMASYTRLRALAVDMVGRGDMSGARHTGRHASTWWRRMSAQEQAAYVVTIP